LRNWDKYTGIDEEECGKSIFILKELDKGGPKFVPERCVQYMKFTVVS
jgi:hypothetical protein